MSPAGSSGNILIFNSTGNKFSYAIFDRVCFCLAPSEAPPALALAQGTLARGSLTRCSCSPAFLPAIQFQQSADLPPVTNRVSVFRGRALPGIFHVHDTRHF